MPTIRGRNLEMLLARSMLGVVFSHFPAWLCSLMPRANPVQIPIALFPYLIRLCAVYIYILVYLHLFRFFFFFFQFFRLWETVLFFLLQLQPVDKRYWARSEGRRWWKDPCNQQDPSFRMKSFWGRLCFVFLFLADTESQSCSPYGLRFVDGGLLKINIYVFLLSSCYMIAI